MFQGFKNDAAEFVFTRTYSKWIPELNRRETWPETVERYLTFIIDERGSKIPEKVIRKMREKMLAFEVMPSMRALWAAGPAAKADNTTLYNCSYLSVDNINSFAEALYILMCAAGVGFGVRKHEIDQLPLVPKIHLSSGNHSVEDSRAGWANSVKELVSSLYNGYDLKFDYNKLRPEGAKLKTMGGRSSGPAPLITLHNFIRDTFYKAQGRKLTSLECHDIMCQIAEIVVVGGVRRSSEISLSDLRDPLMQEAKVGDFPARRWMANNSAVYVSKPPAIEFLQEWSRLAASGTGERGIFNLEAAISMIPSRRNKELIKGTNPSLRGGTKVITEKGIFNIEELEQKQFKVKNLNGELSEATCWLSGTSEKLYEIELQNGKKYYSTKEHRWPVVEGESVNKKFTHELKVGDSFPVLKQDYLFNGDKGTYEDGFVIGWLYGDGWTTIRTDNQKTQFGWIVSNKDIEYGIDIIIENFLKKITGNDHTGCIRTHGKEYNSTNNKLKEYLLGFGVDHKSKGFPEAVWKGGTENFRKGFVDGLLSSAGSVDNNSGHARVSLLTSNLKMAEDFSDLLGFYGIISNITTKIIKGNFPNKKDYNKLYTAHSVRFQNKSNLSHFNSLFKISLQYKQDKLIMNYKNSCKEQNKIQIKSIKLTNLEEKVWDISVQDKTHCFQLSHTITGNCGEILLRNQSFCNLSEVVIRETDDLDSLLDKVETATWIGIIQSTFTYFPYLDPAWTNNCNEERLLGVSLTGQMDNPDILTPEALKAMKARALKVSKKAAQIMGINMPAAITCVKPSGTVSQVVDSASGIHPRFAKYYIRRYRISSTDPLCKLLHSQNIPLSPENGQRKKDWAKAEKIYNEVKNELSAKAVCPIFKVDEEWSDSKVNTWIISFPIKAPEHSLVVNDFTALQQLEMYKKVQTNWCEHNTSITVYVKDNEWFEVGNWVYKNWDIVNGISFLPYDGGKYEQTPYEEIDKEAYEKLIQNHKKIDYSKLSDFEKEDMTEGAKTYNCTGDKCELV